MTNNVKTNIFEYTDKKLRAHSQNNEDFSRELAIIFEFYKARLQQFINDEDTDRMEKELLESIKSQLFNGYFMFLEFLNSEETTVIDEWFIQSTDMIAQQLPDFLRTISGNNLDDVITNQPLKQLSSWLVMKYEGVYPFLMDISLNTACMGAKWAILDEGNKRGLKPYQSQHRGILGNLDDVTFINPQCYISCNIMNEAAEVWDIINSNYSELDKIGEVTTLSIQGEEGNESFYMNINLKNSLSQVQQQELINSLVTRLIVLKKIERTQITLTSSSVEGFYYFLNN